MSLNFVTSYPWLAFLMLGIVTGVASGVFGIGGGIILVPALVLMFQYSQTTASGTSLVAMLLPVGALAVWNYWRAGKIAVEHIQAGLWIGVGIAVGALLGSQVAIVLNQDVLRRIFAIFLVVVAVRMWFS